MSQQPHASDLRSRVLAEVLRTPSPTRTMHKRRLLLVMTMGALATASLFLVMGGMKPGTRPAEMIAFTAGFGLVAAALMTRVSSSRHSMLGHPRSVLLAAVGATAPVLAVVVFATAVAWPEHTTDDVGVRAHLACGVLALVQGILPLIALVWPRRGSDPVHPALTGAALGMTAGAWTVVMAYLRCPHGGVVHCIAAHVGPTLLLTALGAALGWRILRVK